MLDPMTLSALAAGVGEIFKSVPGITDSIACATDANCRQKLQIAANAQPLNQQYQALGETQTAAYLKQSSILIMVVLAFGMAAFAGVAYLILFSPNGKQ